MRVRSVVFVVAIVCLLPIAAAADISRISPQSVPYGSVEDFLTIFGSGLSGNESTVIVFDGPAGQFANVPSNYLPGTEESPQYPGDLLQVFIPLEVAYVAGQYQVTVVATDAGENPRISGPVTFTIGAQPLDGPPSIFSQESIFVEATSRDGAVVDFDVTAQSTDGTPVPVTCNPSFGTTFPIGAMFVTCTATDSFGTTTASIYVVVGDNTPPVVVVPDDIITTSREISYQASAVDLVDGNLAVSCSPQSGSIFPDGITQVVCTATDSSFNVGVGRFFVELPGGQPVITVPADITVDSPDGARVIVPFVVTATNDAIITCDWLSDEFYPGTTTVTCTATNFRGSDTDSFNVTVRDLTSPAPELTVPADITAEATSASGAVVTFTATATNGGVVVCTPASGSTFALGQTTVNCTATTPGGSDSDSFTITVRDTTPPVLTLPADITAEATGPNGAVVAFAAFASDAVRGVIPATCTPASGGTFPIGTTGVACTASDAAGHAVGGGFNVTVRDTTPPALNLPANITAEAHFPGNAKVEYTASASDAVDGNVAISCTPPSGSKFNMGTTGVSCNARDSRGNIANGGFTVTVSDTRPPIVLLTEALPGALWPADRRMVDVTVLVVAFDTVDILPTYRIVSVSSNQPVTGPGDNTSPDWVILGPHSVKLRAERTNNVERVYTITVETSDQSGNTVTTTEKVYVAKIRRRAS
jgi:hypothetical protein